MEFNHSYFKFMHDIIESGLWGKLSATAKTLYPVLCKFTNESFKEVWPGTEELLRLTGFKTKKSLQLAKKELMDAGLLDFVPGTGRKSSRYYFKFDYPNSRCDLDRYRDTIVSLREGRNYPSEGDRTAQFGDKNISPNNININIQTNNNDKQEVFFQNIENLLKQFLEKSYGHSNFKSEIINNMLNKYGDLEVGEAIKIAIQKGKNGDIKYLEGILRNRKKPIDNGQPSMKHSKLNHIDIINQLKLKFNDIENNLKFLYYYNGKYYFKSNLLQNNYDIEKFALEAGYDIKLISSNNNSVSIFDTKYKNGL